MSVKYAVRSECRSSRSALRLPYQAEIYKYVTPDGVRAPATMISWRPDCARQNRSLFVAPAVRHLCRITAAYFPSSVRSGTSRRCHCILGTSFVGSNFRRGPEPKSMAADISGGGGNGWPNRKSAVVQSCCARDGRAPSQLHQPPLNSKTVHNVGVHSRRTLISKPGLKIITKSIEPNDYPFHL